MRGLAGIVSDQRPGLVRKRTYDRYPFNFRLERKQSIVLEQDHRLVRELAGLHAMFGAIQFLLIDLGVGNHLRRVEHAELDSCGE